MSELEEQIDKGPFHPDNAAGLSLITQMRIYDVLLALLNHFDEDTANSIYEAHLQGMIVSSLPTFAGSVEDETNE